MVKSILGSRYQYLFLLELFWLANQMAEPILKKKSKYLYYLLASNFIIRLKSDCYFLKNVFQFDRRTFLKHPVGYSVW